MRIIFAAAIGIILSGCGEKPLGWGCTGDLLPTTEGTNLYLVTAPDGQQFLVSSKGGIVQYVRKDRLEAGQ